MVRASSPGGPSQGVPASAHHLSALPRWCDVHAPPCCVRLVECKQSHIAWSHWGKIARFSWFDVLASVQHTQDLKAEMNTEPTDASVSTNQTLCTVHRLAWKSYYSGTCLRWSLCKAATSLKQPASLAPDSTKALESISAEQPPLYNGQLELAHRRLS